MNYRQLCPNSEFARPRSTFKDFDCYMVLKPKPRGSGIRRPTHRRVMVAEQLYKKESLITYQACEPECGVTLAMEVVIRFSPCLSFVFDARFFRLANAEEVEKKKTTGKSFEGTYPLFPSRR